MEKKVQNSLDEQKKASARRTHCVSTTNDDGSPKKRSYAERLCEFYVNKPKLAFGKYALFTFFNIDVYLFVYMC